MANMMQQVIGELTALPFTDLPFLSIYLDWRTDGNGKRPSVMLLEQELTRIGGDLPERGPARDSFDADRERIMDYVVKTSPDNAESVVIFACNGADVWRTLAFQTPAETSVAVDQYAHVFNLAKMIDDFEPYALVLASGQEAQIYVVMYNAPSLQGETEASEKIKRFDAGGPGQMLFQRRTDNLIKAHIKDIATELDTLMRRFNIERIVIGGNDAIKGIVMEALPDRIKAKLLDYVNVDRSADIGTTLEKIAPIVRAAEDKQEATIVADLEDRVATKGGLGFVGIHDVKKALSKGQVDTLILHQNFGGTGTIFPLGDTQPHTTDLREGFVSQAFRQSATVEIIADSAFLEQHDGVGALLRYRDDPVGVAAHQVGDGIA